MEGKASSTPITVGTINAWLEAQQNQVATEVMPEIVEAPKSRGAIRILMALGLVGEQSLTESVEEVATELQAQGVSPEATQAWTRTQVRPLFARQALKAAQRTN